MNHHCSVVEIAGAGVMIEGASGSGKTSLALGLVDVARSRGLEAALVCDDQALVTGKGGILTASCPPTIEGMAEIRGFGIARMEPHLPTTHHTAIRLVVRLVDDEFVERMPESKTTEICGVRLALVECPVRHEAQGIRIVLAWLSAFDKGVAH
ncbi:MAG: HPr kinase/phosphorylase [Nitratireductor sp.]